MQFINVYIYLALTRKHSQTHIAYLCFVGQKSVPRESYQILIWYLLYLRGRRSGYFFRRTYLLRSVEVSSLKIVKIRSGN